MIKENIEEEETSLDDSDSYAGFDEYGNWITGCDIAGPFGLYSHLQKLW